MKIQSRINLLGYSKSDDVSGTALSHTIVKTVIPSQEKTILDNAEDNEDPVEPTSE